MQSLTPRETSSGLRRPLLAGGPPAGGGAPPAFPTLAPIKRDSRRAGREGSSTPTSRLSRDLWKPPPTAETIRASVRGLKERKANIGPFDPTEGPSQSLSAAIRQRTAMTLKQAMSAPDTADLDASREAELQMQRTKLEDLKRTFDLLHAELVAKEGVRAPRVARAGLWYRAGGSDRRGHGGGAAYER